MGFNLVRYYLICASCKYRADAEDFVEGICPKCGYEGQYPA